MKAIKIENATIVGLTKETVTMQSGETRNKQQVLFTENTANGVQLHGCSVWDENIEKLDLQQGETYAVQCKLVGRQWGGRFNYELIAFDAQKVEQTKQAF